MSSSDVDTIKSRCGIVDVVGGYVKLKRAGRNMSGLCPFHREKTPSFVVSPEKGSFKCFGCGVGGDVLQFVQTIEGLSFPETLQLLADKYNITLSGPGKKTGVSRTEKDSLISLMEEVIGFYNNRLQKNSSALAYLKNRGVDKELQQKWRLGCAPDAWRELSEKFPQEKLSKLGLIKTNENGKTYDTFRNRIVFPISDPQGKYIAMSGRAMGDDEPKYLNSPETFLFNKSKTLHGYAEAKTTMRKLDYAVVVEGQFDLLLCHKAGLLNTVATSGTAITLDHIKLIKRSTDNLLFIMDSDNAGQKSLYKASILGIAEGCSIKTVTLPEGKDPADIVTTDGKEALINLVKSSKDIFTYVAETYNELKDNRASIFLHETVLPLLQSIPSHVTQHRMIQKVARIMNVPEHVLTADIEQLPKTKVQGIEEISEDEKPVTRDVLQNYVACMYSYVDTYKDSDAAETIKVIEKKLSDLFNSGYRESAKNRDVDTESLVQPKKYLWELMEKIEKQLLINHKNIVEQKIKIAEKNSSASVESLLREWQEVQQKLLSLSEQYK
jgi:DNA primase